ncbi:hypothetical protein D3C73_1600710 [compost metagenome]
MCAVQAAIPIVMVRVIITEYIISKIVNQSPKRSAMREGMFLFPSLSFLAVLHQYRLASVIVCIPQSTIRPMESCEPIVLL